MKKISFCIFLACLLVTPLFGQINNATLTGTVSDATKAVLPGVMVTATNNATNVVSTVLTNEAGAYTILSLPPGTYTVSAELSGFQKETYSRVELGNAVTVRLNFALQVASQAQSVEVTVAADTLLATSSPTIGQVLTEKRVTDLPVVGNNVLDMLTVLGGLDNFVATSAPGQSAFGREATTLAGVSAQDSSVLRDGIMVQDTRWPTGINSATVINQDLVGEVRVIVAPVDAELGRGNGAVQITTRSGTNQFRGAAVWNIQNNAWSANTWANKRSGLPPNYYNNNQGTISAGGPIVKNKTFFYALWDMNFNRQRANTYATVLTPCARNGVFRYFDNWNNGAVGATTVPTGANPTRTVVNLDGSPLTPTTNPNGTPYTGQLRYISVFGPVTFPASGPNADCSNGSISGSPWDQFRTGADTTGLIKRTIGLMPAPNDFTNANGTLTSVDGLNVGSYKYVRRFRGLDNLFSVGESTGDRRQINLKVDHNFSQQHRGNVNVSYERVASDDTVAGLPGTWSNQNFHRPIVVTAGFVSVLSSALVNEARFGFRRTGTNVLAPWDLPENQAGINGYLPPKVNGFLVLPDITGVIGVCSPITGARPPGNCIGGGAAGNNITATATDKSPLWTYGDTFSWTKGKHTYKFGGEVRFASSTSRSSSQGAGSFFTNFKAPVVLVAGATPGSQLPVAGPTAIANTNPVMAGIGSTDASRARNMLLFLSGSLSSVNNLYWLTDPKATTFSDYRNFSLVTNTIKQREFDFFFKDDYKIRKNLTLNLGIRYDWYGVPYAANGLTVAPVGGGGAAFGISGRDFSSWMKPGPRADVTTLQFVGPGSPNPGKSVYPDKWTNFGPAVGFAWQVPWFGEGKTTVRGGYQITYQGGSRFNTLEVPLSFPPGRTYNGSFVGDSGNPYLDLSKAASAVIPTPVPVQPMQPIQLTDRSQRISFFDPNYTAPYVQNLTLSVTRSLQPNLTLDLRYIGTLARKQFTSFDLNLPNFLYNGLGAEFDTIRAGGESAVLDRMFNGVNICATGCAGGVTYGPVGTVVNGVPQTAALQMRSSATFNQNLANGNYPLVAGSLSTLNYVKVGGANANLPDIPPTVQGAVLRFNNFPENFINTNPQFTNQIVGFGGAPTPGVTYLTNSGNGNYHSLQVELGLRPTHGLNGTANYTWSRNLGVPATPFGGFGPAAAFTNPVDRHSDYTIVNGNHPHVLRTNGNIELPIGPGKVLFRNSSGPLARAIEDWRLGFIYTLSSGPWVSITAQNMLYANGVPDVANGALLKELLGDAGVHWGTPAGLFTEGSYWDPAKWTKVPDPQCGTVTLLQNLNGLQTGSSNRCVLQAVAKIVPAGTSGSVPLNDGSGNSGLIVLQNPLPGHRGNLGQNVLRGLPIWRFDTNLSKAFKITETTNLQFRVDAFNVLNHPQPVGPNNAINPSLSINPTLTAGPTFGAAIPWGQLTSKLGARVFQGQLRLNF